MNATLFAVILLAMADAAPAAVAPPETWLDVLKSLGALLIQVGTIVGVVVTYLESRKGVARGTANAAAIEGVAQQSDANGQKMDDVHRMSNSRLTAMQDRIEELTSLVGHLQGEAVGLAQGQASGDARTAAAAERAYQHGALQEHGLGPDPLNPGPARFPDPPRSGPI
jgi:hypothetical protein